MTAVLMSCPTTGLVVATGQHFTPAEFEALTLFVGRFRCSACQQVHSWTKAEVRLADLPGAPSRVT